MTKLSTGMQRVIIGKYFSVQYIVSYRDIHASCIPLILGHFNYIQHAMPFKQSKSNIQRI